LGAAAPLEAAGERQPSVAILDDGTLSVPNSAEIPPYSHPGQWIEGKEKSSTRFFTRYFVFQVPNKPPALELFVTRDLVDEAPDGVFEMSLARGFLSGFSGKAGFSFANPVFEDGKIGSTKAKRCAAQLSKGNRTIWLYAYIYARKPSLTFITVRAESNARESIENYLATLRLK